MRLNPQKTADLVTFTEEILNGKLHFLCNDYSKISSLLAEDSLLEIHLLFHQFSISSFQFQKQPLEVFYKKKVFWEICKMHRKTPGTAKFLRPPCEISKNAFPYGTHLAAASAVFYKMIYTLYFISNAFFQLNLSVA